MTKLIELEYMCDACKDTFETPSGSGCPECCPHDEFDHYMCLECGYEKCPGDDIDAAMHEYDLRNGR